MITVHIRKQGGAAIITIPADLLKMLNLQIGAELELDVTKQGLIAKPVLQHKRKRYTLDELLKGCTPRKMKALKEATKWFREIKPRGREIL